MASVLVSQSCDKGAKKRPSSAVKVLCHKCVVWYGTHLRSCSPFMAGSSSFLLKFYVPQGVFLVISPLAEHVRACSTMFAVSADIAPKSCDETFPTFLRSTSHTYMNFNHPSYLLPPSYSESHRINFINPF